ncbi:hypothetical protein [Streptomyces sp. NPDC026673]|uniref:hypothetical protein n=1 Tax=Streptomyces sp. NPDC026673 TaxID=3155724 RepID=UPI0033F273BC
MNSGRDLPAEETERTFRLGPPPADAPPADAPPEPSQPPVPPEDAAPEDAAPEDAGPEDSGPRDAPPAKAGPAAGDTSADGADPAREYSATVLAEHWAPATLPTARLEPTVTADGPVPTVKAGPTVVLPDRVEGEVMRFGPGVTPAAAARASVAAEVWRGLTAPPAPPEPRRRRWARRYALAATVLAAVLLFLAWQRFAPGLEVERVTVTAFPSAPACDTTVDLVAVVTTNGRAGTISYRWLRNDGTSSDVLHEKVPSGRHEARLHLLWTFRGHGTYTARAELRLTTPGHRSVTTGFTYDCR